MSTQYRISRNIEASIIDYIKAELISANWTNIEVKKSFSQVYEINLPSICIRLSDTKHEYVEIGDTSTIREPVVFIDIFGSSDGNRLDLKDFLIDILKGGCPYYEYTINNGEVETKTQNGRIFLINLEDSPINFDVSNKSNLDVHDRYRHLITLTLTLNRMEI